MEGKPVRSYEGRGTLRHAGDQTVECAFVATQSEDGAVDLTCTSEVPGIPDAWVGELFGPRSDRAEPDGFSGATRDGVPVEIAGPLLSTGSSFKSNAPAQLVYTLTGPARLHVGDARCIADPATEFRFLVSNLIFEGVFKSGMEMTTLELDGVSVRLQHLPDYDERAKALKRSRSFRATSEIRISTRVGLDVATELAGDVCDLCSLARGTVINWICYDVVSATGECRYSYHLPALVYHYAGGLPLIDPRFPLELKEFLEACLSPYRRLRDQREFRTVVHASCEARGAGFLDTRSLVCVSLLEHILGKDAEEYGGATVLPPSVFKARVSRLVAAVKALLRLAFPDATEDQLDQIGGHVQGFNWSSPRKRLRRMANRLGIPETELPKEEIERILDTRNSLVHRLTFHTNDQLGEYLRLVWILDRLVIGLLGYEGIYRDARTGRRVAARKKVV